MAGRNRKPIALHLANDNPSHLSKSEIADRQEKEVNVPYTNVKPPGYLNTKQKRIFKGYAQKLVSIGIMTELDIDCLARYVMAHDMYIAYTEELNKAIAAGQLSIAKEFRLLQNTAFKQASASACALGLTVTSRCKIEVPQPSEDDDDEL